MAEKPYHHGNLRNTLIEAGIKLINKEGEQQFSLRKVAALCGVSHAAPYSHFQSREELLEAMQDYVTEQFMKMLDHTIQSYSEADGPDLLVQIGKSYVMFFIGHPQYFQFLFSRPLMEIDLSLKENGNKNFPPFELFKNTAVRVLKETGLSDQKIKDSILSMWALVHGLASIATMKNVRYDENWETKIEDLIRNEQNH